MKQVKEMVWLSGIKYFDKWVMRSILVGDLTAGLLLFLKLIFMFCYVLLWFWDF